MSQALPRGSAAAIAKNLADEGAAVVVNYASSKEGAERVAAEITAKGGKAVAVQADIAKKADIERLFAETRKAFGRLDVLVNNAGIYEFAPLAEVTPEHFHRMFDLNVLGLILATQEAVKYFGSEGGSVVNISSVVSTAAPERIGLQRHESRRGRGNEIAGQRARGTQDPGQFHQSRDGRNRGHDFRRHRRRE